MITGELTNQLLRTNTDFYSSTCTKNLLPVFFSPEYHNIKQKLLTRILPRIFLMKSLNVMISLAGLTSFLLVAASLLGFSSVMPKAAASLSIDDATTDATTTAPEDNGGGNANAATTMLDNTSLNTLASTGSIVKLSEQPVAVGHYRTVSNNMTNETQAQFTFEGNTKITLPNATETITTRDTGEGTFSFLPGSGGGSPSGQIHMTTEDGSESATANFTEFIKFDSSTGIGIAYFSTNSTGTLAPLNNMIAVFLDEIQPNEDSIIRFFEWKSDGGEPTGVSNNSTITNGGGNETTTTS
jgi:hypothetical protein